MAKDLENLKLLLVDDEDDFRLATSTTLKRRGFEVEQAANGEEALACIKQKRPDIVLLDMKMPGMSGIETLKEIRAIDANLPVIILTGHGDYDSAMAGIKLDIVDFLQKPVDVDQLGRRIRHLMERGAEEVLRERTISELMVPPSMYPKIYVDDPITAVLNAMKEAFYKPVPEEFTPGRVRSALVYDRDEKFLTIVRFNDMLQLLIPPFLSDSPYASYFTGMFLAQCKVIGNRSISELTEKPVTVNVDMPLMEAIHLLVENHLINIPVMDNGNLIGVLRGRDVVLEIARCHGFTPDRT
jgi:CheY-like chemotaxis protein